MDLEWISATYAVVYGAFIITWGRLGDMLGRRRIFMAGIATFIVGSSMVGFANSIGMIILGRAVQGMGAAMSSPATLSILSATFSGRAREESRLACGERRQVSVEYLVPCWMGGLRRT